MGFKCIRPIPTPDEVKEELPLSSSALETKEKRDRCIREVFENKSDKKIIIIGPCSADNEDSVMDYMVRLAALADQVSDKLILIPRIYTNKPRTTGEGYKGMLHQPDICDEPNMHKGIYSIRKLHKRLIEETGLTAADEMLYPENCRYLDDILAYHAVGARSVENQEHRLIASGINEPIGMKNPTSGDLNVMLNSIKAAQLPHRFILNGFEVQTDGNPLAHAILRGAINHYGTNIPNYHYEDLVKLSERYLAGGQKNPAVIVDSNHANSMKNWQEQPRIAKEVMHHARSSETVNRMVKGLMIESYLMDGAQPETGTNYGQSITDGCLGWEKTERLVLELADMVR
ncbi:3-deoxy-7-phosphoheptulonate synthase [Dehalobacterium formicoaceticum]|uniref:Phospho-2-dehydro-3-deoxyheptonate aldolase n=1 Tax=Dehalobacterium formicoaceticum TaxID=51515 RepID=A0ABT1Y4F9_9FIRM|nr:3-deoxy-7-phosphoheptulonate synthase [Dehalobacterium formicoaceticum]MCR6545765.1 3-deoxy-7-phosphoheptulonate synthase [Dehalobacterium formicoaceticum]